MAGLSSTGFETKRLEDVIASVKARAVATFGPNINTEDDAVLGQLIDILAPEFVSLWELSEADYNAFVPSSAEGAQLDDSCAIVGVVRQAASNSRVNCTLLGDTGTVIPAASTFSKSTDGFKFDTEVSVDMVVATSVTGVIISQVTSAVGNYEVTVAGDLVTYVSASTDPAVIAAGIEAAINGDVTVGAVVTATHNVSDDTVVVRTDDILTGVSFAVSANMQFDKAYQIVSCLAQETGAVRAPLTTINTIDTPISGLDTVTNEEEPNLGRTLETDTELRIRRADSLRLAGSATPDAIRAAVANVSGVSTVFLVENQTNVTDPQGREPKSFEVIVEGGDDTEIAQAIQDNRPAGIQTVNRGSQAAVSATDSEGNLIDIFFSRPVSIVIDLEIDYSLYTEETFPVGGEDAMAQAAFDFGSALGIGTDIFPPKFLGPIYDAVVGIGDMEVRARRDADPFATTSISIEASEVSTFNLTQITNNITLI